MQSLVDKPPPEHETHARVFYDAYAPSPVLRTGKSHPAAGRSTSPISARARFDNPPEWIEGDGRLWYTQAVGK